MISSELVINEIILITNSVAQPKFHCHAVILPENKMFMRSYTIASLEKVHKQVKQFLVLVRIATIN